MHRIRFNTSHNKLAHNSTPTEQMQLLKQLAVRDRNLWDEIRDVSVPLTYFQGANEHRILVGVGGTDILLESYWFASVLLLKGMWKQSPNFHV